MPKESKEAYKKKVMRLLRKRWLCISLSPEYREFYNKNKKGWEARTKQGKNVTKLKELFDKWDMKYLLPYSETDVMKAIQQVCPDVTFEDIKNNIRLKSFRYLGKAGGIKVKLSPRLKELEENPERFFRRLSFEIQSFGNKKMREDYGAELINICFDLDTDKAKLLEVIESVYQNIAKARKMLEIDRKTPGELERFLRIYERIRHGNVELQGMTHSELLEFYESTKTPPADAETSVVGKDESTSVEKGSGTRTGIYDLLCKEYDIAKFFVEEGGFKTI